MFRTGHRTDHTAWTEPAPERPVVPEPVAEGAPAAVAPAAESVVRSAPRPLTAAVADTTIGQGVTFDGTLRFTGTMRMSGGTFSGTVSGDTLVVGDSATLAADATCGSIEVHGEARGTLTARDGIELRSPARVTADVSAPSLVIEKGVVLEGTVRMGGPNAARAPKRVTTPE